MQWHKKGEDTPTIQLENNRVVEWVTRKALIIIIIIACPKRLVKGTTGLTNGRFVDRNKVFY